MNGGQARASAGRGAQARRSGAWARGDGPARRGARAGLLGAAAAAAATALALWPAAAPALPDGRAYELVTPVEKNGLRPEEAVPAIGGDAVDWQAQGGLGPAAAPGLNLYQSRRTGTGTSGWETSALTPAPATPLGGPLEKQSPVFYSTELTQTIFSTPASFAGGDADSEHLDLYLRSPTGALSWLSQGARGGTGADQVTFDAATPDAAEVVFSTAEPLTANASELEDTEGAEYLYVRNVAAGETSLVDVNTEGRLSDRAGAILGDGTHLAPPAETVPASYQPADAGGTTTNAISSDGSEIYFTSPPPSTRPGAPMAHLYVRQDNARTISIDNTEDTEGSATYAGASQSGSLMFFTSDEGLDGAPTDNELYEFNSTSDTVTWISGGEAATEGRVVGVTAVANDGSHIYFIADGALTAIAGPQGSLPAAGSPNLYVYDTTSAKTAFVATVALADIESESESPSGLVAEPDVERPAVPTPNGEVLVFASHAPLTTADSTERDPDAYPEIFRYHTPTGLTPAGELECISCQAVALTPSGELTEASELTEGAGLGEGIGGGSYAPAGKGVPMDQEGSRIFFQSADPLTAEALQVRTPTGASPPTRVYEWTDQTQPPSVALISGGASSLPASADGTTPTAADVFFTTAAALIPQDTDGGYANIYDARVGGGFPVATAPQPICLADGCRAAINPAAVFATPASEAAEASEGTPADIQLPTPHLGGHAKHKRKRKHKHRKHKRSHKASKSAGAAAVRPGDRATLSASAAGARGVVPGATTSAANLPALTPAGAGADPIAELADGESARPLDFGLKSFSVTVSSTQAGSHPDLTSTFAFQPNGADTETGEPKDVAIDLPAGFVGNPQAVAQCTPAAFSVRPKGLCQPSAQVGTLAATGLYKGVEIPLRPTPVYNLTPSPGSVATLGVSIGVPVLIQLRVRSEDGSYGLTATISDLSPPLPLAAATLTLWGVPADTSHEGERYGPSGAEPPQPAGVAAAAFLTYPSQCGGGPLTSTLSADSWASPDSYVTGSATLPAPTGCQLLRVAPSLSVTPDDPRADAPSGYEIDLGVPQSEEAYGLATPDLETAAVTLPAGTSLSPAAANDLAQCSQAQFQAHGSTGGTQCPAASVIGAASLRSPLLDAPLEGDIYLGAPAAAAGPDDYRVFMVASGDNVSIALEGKITADPTTGGLVVKLYSAPEDSLPQQPLADVRLRFFGGPLAVLANPPTCGAATTTAVLGFYGGASATVTSQFTVQAADASGTCTSPAPFDPQVSAGSGAAQAGAFSPFTLTVGRQDGEQSISTLAASLPAGLLGNLAGVPVCGEPAAAAGQCSPASQVGVATVGVGSGSEPLFVQGPIYLTGPYGQGPFGLALVLPIDAGPFALGTQVVRAQLLVDPTDLHLTIISGALPQTLGGIPLRVHTVSLAVNRPQFMFNPTQCGSLAVSTTVTSTGGATATATNPFQSGGCARLGFTPTVSASVAAAASYAGANASLQIRVAMAAGQANMRAVSVTLPSAVRPRLNALQGACVAAVFDANPAACPATAIVGKASIATPVLGSPLSGSVYLVGHGKAAPPSLDMNLGADGVNLAVQGRVAVSRGRFVSATFAGLPDIPVSALTLDFTAGSDSLLAAVKRACATSVGLPYSLTAQDGARLGGTLAVRPTGCSH